MSGHHGHNHSHGGAHAHSNDDDEEAHVTIVDADGDDEDDRVALLSTPATANNVNYNTSSSSSKKCNATTKKKKKKMMTDAINCTVFTPSTATTTTTTTKPKKHRRHSHSHSHGHGHGHGHAHGDDDDDDTEQQQNDPAIRKASRQLYTAAALCCVFMVAEFVGGYYANSLAIMTDAAHLLSDFAGFFISIFALYLTTLKPTATWSFGFHRAEILGALLSVFLIWALTGVLVYEAILRLFRPEKVDGKLMFFIACGGLAVNIVMGFVLHQSGHSHSHGGGLSHGHSHGGHGDDESNVNVRAAFIHAVGDAIQSVGVMIAGALIWWRPEYHIADPICTFVFSILVLGTTVRLVQQSLNVLMEGVPEGLDPAAVEADLAAIPNVISVYDLHIWSLSVGKPALSVHLYIDPTGTGGEMNRFGAGGGGGGGRGNINDLICAQSVCTQEVLVRATEICATKYNITHTTIQTELVEDDDDEDEVE